MIHAVQCHWISFYLSLWRMDWWFFSTKANIDYPAQSSIQTLTLVYSKILDQYITEAYSDRSVCWISACHASSLLSSPLERGSAYFFFFSFLIIFISFDCKTRIGEFWALMDRVHNCNRLSLSPFSLPKQSKLWFPFTIWYWRAKFHGWMNAQLNSALQNVQ